MSPYEAMFGYPAKVGLQFPDGVLQTYIVDEEDFENILNQNDIQRQLVAEIIISEEGQRVIDEPNELLLPELTEIIDARKCQELEQNIADINVKRVCARKT